MKKDDNMSLKKSCFFIAAVILLASCSTVSVNYSTITKDTSEKAEGAVLVLGLEINDPFFYFNNKDYKYLPVIGLEKIDRADSAALNLRSQAKSGFWTGALITNPWKVYDDKQTYKENYYLFLEPGEYYLDDLVFLLSSVTYSSGYNSTTTVTTTYHFYLDSAFVVEEGKINNLGTLTVNVLGFTGEGDDEKIERELYFSQNVYGEDPVLAEMEVKYPDVMESFNNDIYVPPFYVKYINSFDSFYDSGDIGSPWGPVDSDQISCFYWNGEYYLKKEQNQAGYTYITFALPVETPKNFSLEWTSVYRSGEKDNLYGLLFGAGNNDYYSFGTSAGGNVVINHYDNNSLDSTVLDEQREPSQSYSGMRKEHRLEFRDFHVRYYEDNELIGDFDFKYKMKSPFFAFFIQSRGLIGFDNLIFTELQEE